MVCIRRLSPRLAATAAAIVLCASAGPSRAENWPQWRGPQNNGLSAEANLPTEWSKTENVAWRLPLPGPAGATPVVWNDRIFLTSPDGDDLVLMCISTGGKELWRKKVSAGNQTVRGDEGNSCSPSPVTDGKHVWTTMGTGAVACFDFDGNEVWKLDLGERFGKIRVQFGYTSSPVLHGDHLYFQLIHGDGNASTREARVAALNKLTGETVWQRERDSDATAECEHSYASPVLYDDGKLTYLVTHGADFAVAHRLTDGSEIWRCGGLNPKKDYNPTLRFVASPVAASGIIVVPSAKNGPVVALRADGEGDLTTQENAKRWTMPRNTPDVPSPLVHDGLVYLCRENGNLICLDAESGEQLYEKLTTRDRHRASPVCADGKIYLTARNGRISVVQEGRKFELLAQNDLEESISASPVISNGILYFRTFEALWAIRNP